MPSVPPRERATLRQTYQHHVYSAMQTYLEEVA